jgi:hypothetical protein
METEIIPVVSVTGLFRRTAGGLEPLTTGDPLTQEEVGEMPVFYEMELHPEQQDADLVVEIIYDNMKPIRLQDLVRGTDIPWGVRFWPDWFEIPPFREARDADGRRVYPRSPGIHTVRIRTARRKREHAGRVRDFSPKNGGSTSPAFEFTIKENVIYD